MQPQPIAGAAVIWVKTEAGIAELKSHALIQQAPTQNLLRVIDGVKTEELLLKYLPGVTLEDFRLLARLGFIQRVPSQAAAVQPPVATPQRHAGIANHAGSALRNRRLAMVLSRLVSLHLGLAGMALTSAISRATSEEQLDDLSRQLITTIRARKGDNAAAEALNELRGLI